MSDTKLPPGMPTAREWLGEDGEAETEDVELRDRAWAAHVAELEAERRTVHDDLTAALGQALNERDEARAKLAALPRGEAPAAAPLGAPPPRFVREACGESSPVNVEFFCDREHGHGGIHFFGGRRPPASETPPTARVCPGHGNWNCMACGWTAGHDDRFLALFAAGRGR